MASFGGGRDLTSVQIQEEVVQVLQNSTNKRKGFIADSVKNKLLFWRGELDQATKSEPSSRKASRCLPPAAPAQQNSNDDRKVRPKTETGKSLITASPVHARQLHL
jgi:hypothetical protein